MLFGALVPGRGVTPATTRMTLLSVQVAGVPDIHVEEALWTVAEILGTGHELTRPAGCDHRWRWPPTSIR